MSLFTSLLQPILEREILSLEPELAQALLTLIKKMSADGVEWAESKMNLDLNNDGVIGQPKDEG